MHTSNKNINAVEMLAEQIVKATQSHTHAYDQTFSSVIKAVPIILLIMAALNEN